VSIKPPRPASVDPAVAAALDRTSQTAQKPPAWRRGDGPRPPTPRDPEAPPPGAADALRRRAAEAASSRPKPPADNDERLATWLRGPEDDPTRVELRASWCLYNSGAYLRLHTWERGSDGQMWPVKGAAVTIRRRELGAFAEAVATALDRAEAVGQRTR